MSKDAFTGSPPDARPSSPQLFPNGRSSRGAGQSLRRVSTDGVIIYTSEPEVRLPAPVKVDPFDTISNALVTVARIALPIVIPIAIEWIKEELKDSEEGAKDGKSGGAATDGAGTKATTCNCQCNISVNAPVNVNVNNNATGGTAAGGSATQNTPPAQGGTTPPAQSGATPPEQGGTTPPAQSGATNPPATGGATGGNATGGDAKTGQGSATGGSAQGGDATSKAGGAQGGNAEGGAAVQGGIKIAPPDASAWKPNSDALGQYQQIMDEFLSMSFSDGAAAAAHLQQQVRAAGLTVTLTGNGFEVSNRVPDPGRVAEQLRSQGVRDQELIDTAVAESNAAIERLESFALAAQSALGSEVQQRDQAAISGLAVGQDPAGSASAQPELGAVFRDMVPQWQALVPGGFWSMPGLVTANPTNSSLAEAAPLGTPQVLLAAAYTSPSGVEVRAEINATFDVAAVPDGSGLKLIPFTSVFERQDSWVTRA